MRVYLAAPYVCRDALRAYADELARLGHACTSSWLGETVEVAPGTVGAATALDDKAAAAHVATDIRDIRRSEALVLFTWPASKAIASTDGGNSGGRHVETGVALTLGLPVIVIGEPENIFHRGHGVQTVKDWHEACIVLAELERATPREATR